RGIEQGDRGGLVPARLLVRVVAHHGEPGDGRVDATLETAERRRQLVDRPVQPVDPALQRDGEVDEIAAPAPLQRELRGTDSAEPDVEDERDRKPDHGDGRRRDRDHPCNRRGQWLRLKKTGYEARLLSSVVSPGTLPMSTLTTARAPKALVGSWRLPNVTVFVS